MPLRRLPVGVLLQACRLELLLLLLLLQPSVRAGACGGACTGAKSGKGCLQSRDTPTTSLCSMAIRPLLSTHRLALLGLHVGPRQN